MEWNDSVAELEDNLYSTMCAYGATVKALPDNENITIVLAGLGGDSETNTKADKIHVLSKSDLLSCQSGAIDAAELVTQSKQYTY